MPPPPISLLVPVYNECGAVGESVLRIAALLKMLPPDSEAIFINDGSRDGSRELLIEGVSMTANPSMRLLHHDRNRGYGAALKTGLRAAKHGVIAITDADGTYPIARIPELGQIMANEGATMVVGARPVGDQPVVRQPAKLVLRLLAEHLTGERIPDLNSGLRLFQKDAALRHLSLLPDGFSFTTTITMALLTEGERVLFVPIRYQARVGSSKIKPLQDTVNFLLLILRTALAFNPLKVFGPVGLFLIVAGLTLLALRFALGQQFGLATTIALLVGGLQVLAMGLLADLINRRTPP